METIYLKWSLVIFMKVIRLGTSRPLGERSEPFLATKRPTERRSRERSRAILNQSDEGLVWKV